MKNEMSVLGIRNDHHESRDDGERDVKKQIN